MRIVELRKEIELNVKNEFNTIFDMINRLISSPSKSDRDGDNFFEDI